MKKQLSLIPLILYLFLINCSNDETEKIAHPQRKNSYSVFDSNFTNWVSTQIETTLSIQASEKYDFKIHTNYLDSDSITDAVILVNRAAFAEQKAKEGRDTKFEELTGFTGPFNYIFTFKGGSSKLNVLPPVGSSANHPLTIQFESISNPSQQDFIVEYRVRNSVNRNYYSFNNGMASLIFSCPVFDLMNENNPEIYYIDHVKSNIRHSKDIAMYYGMIEDYKVEYASDFNYYPSQINSSDKLFAYFIYDQRKQKYITPMKPQSD